MEIDLGRLLDTQPGLVWTALPDGRAEYIGKQWLDYTGMTLDEALGAGWTAAVHPDDVSRLLSEWSGIIASGKLGELDARLRRHDGVYRWFLFRACPMPEPSGEVLRWCGMNFDIDDRVRAEAIARQHQNRFERILDGLPVIAGLFDADGRIAFCNRWMLAFLGRTLEEIQAQPWVFTHHPDEREGVRAAWRTAIQTGQPYDREARLLRGDGVYMWHRMMVFPLHNEAGEIDVWYGIVSDIEEARHAQATLSAEKRLLERVAKGVPLPEILDELACAVEALVPGCYCTILTVDESGDHFKLGAAPTLPEGYRVLLDGKGIDPGFGPLSRCIYEKTPIIVVDAENDLRWAASGWPARMKAHGLRSSWTAPILTADGAALAAFAIYRRETKTPTRQELELIDRFTHIAGIAMERAQADAALKARAAELAGEKRLLQMVAAGVSLDEILDALCRQVESLVPAALCCVLKVEPDGQHFRFGAGPSIPAAYRSFMEGNTTEPDSGPCALAVARKAPIISANIAEDPRWAGSPLLPLAAAHGLAACWSMPILAANGEAFGVFAVYRREPASASPGDLELIDRFVHIAGIAMERAQADTALKASEAQLRQAYGFLAEGQRLSKTGSFTWDEIPEKQMWSEEMYRILEMDPRTVMTVQAARALIHPDDKHLFEDTVQRTRAGLDVNTSYRVVTQTGAVKYVRVTSHRVKEITERAVYMGAMQDITEFKMGEEALNKARAELAHVSRAMTLSALTASIAHEVNQPLAGIITNANTGLRMLSTDTPNLEGVRATMQRTLRDGNRASEVIKRLRAMFTRRSPGLECVDLNDAAREVLAIAAGELQQRRVVVSAEFADDLSTVYGDRVQLQQVVLNLVLNAADAMCQVEERPRTLRIATLEAAPDDVQLSVQDTGVGIPADKLEQLFQAFFTTKPDGMGIGLAISRTIIENHRGRLWAAANQDGPGATFAFSLPRTRPAGSDCPELPSVPEPMATTS